jgi:hypothetical protein
MILEQRRSMGHRRGNHHVEGVFAFGRSLLSRLQQLLLVLQVFFSSLQLAFSIFQSEHSLISTDHLELQGL